MPELGTNTQSEERPELRVLSDFSHIPAPPEATWLSEWEFFEGCCPQHQDWVRYFGGRTWTVETCAPEPIEVHVADSQFSDGSIEMWVAVDGDICGLEVDEALMMAATLSQAADEVGRIEGGSL